MAVTRSINRGMMQSATGTSLAFNNNLFALSSPYNVQYNSVNETNSKLKTRCKQAKAVLNYLFVAIPQWADSSTTAAVYGAAPYKMSDFYDLTLDGVYSANHHIPSSGELSIGDASE